MPRQGFDYGGGGALSYEGGKKSYDELVRSGEWTKEHAWRARELEYETLSDLLFKGLSAKQKQIEGFSGDPFSQLMEYMAEEYKKQAGKKALDELVAYWSKKTEDDAANSYFQFLAEQAAKQGAQPPKYQELYSGEEMPY